MTRKYYLERYTILITADNNHSNTIASLGEVGLIFKDPQSPELYPIYWVDRTLIKTDFSKELQAIFLQDWHTIKKDYQDVLQAIYLHNSYGNRTEQVSANSIGNFIYAIQHKVITDLNDFENFKRKVRNIFNQLEAKYFIVRKDLKTKEQGGKPDFMINKNYIQQIKRGFV